MLGWFISITNPAIPPQDGQHVIATWEVDMAGLDWIEALAKEGRATVIRRDVYPNEYSISAETLAEVLPKILNGPQEDWIDRVRYFPKHIDELKGNTKLLVTASDLS